MGRDGQIQLLLGNYAARTGLCKLASNATWLMLDSDPQRAGVDEYVAILIKEQRIEWRFLQAGSYRPLNPDPAGIFRSRIFPGLWLDERAYWHDDSARLLALLENGLTSDEHANFLRRLHRD